MRQQFYAARRLLSLPVFLAGTFFPSFLAFERPMAIACLRLVTFLPLCPLFSVPFFMALISVSTFLPADGEYLRRDDFFDALFIFAALFVAISFSLKDWMARPLRRVAPWLDAWIASFGESARACAARGLDTGSFFCAACNKPFTRLRLSLNPKSFSSAPEAAGIA
jgi:hypothetical protein